MEVNTEAPVVEGTEHSSSSLRRMDSDPSESTAAMQPQPPPTPPEDDDVDPFYKENNSLFGIMELLDFTVQPRRSKSNPDGVTFDGDKDARNGERECSSCTGEKYVDELFKKLETDIVSEKEREIEKLTKDLDSEREARVDSDKKSTKLVEFISYIHEEFGKLVKSFVSLTTKNLDICNVLNLGPFQDEAETDEFLEGLNSLAKQLLDEFENLGDTKNVLERMNEILKANVEANTNLNVPEDIEETCSQEYENVDDDETNVRSGSSVSTVVVEPEISDTIEDRPLNSPPMPKVRISKRRKVIKTEFNLDSANKRHGMDYSRRHQGHYCLCGFQYSTITTLKAHVRYKTWVWKFACDICKKRFQFASRLRIHLRQTHGIIDLAHSAFTCSQCGESFENRKEQIKHSRNVHPSRNGVFEGPTGRTKSGGIRGRRNARGRGGRRGANDIGTRTRRVHQSAAPLHGIDRASSAIQCICGNIYSHKSALSVHISTKLYGKIFKCRDCGKRFITHRDLKKHARIAHNTDYLQGKYGCGICGEPCDSMMDLRSHRLEAHEVEWGGGGRGKKSLGNVTNLPEEGNPSIDDDDDPPPPILFPNYGDDDVEVNQFNSDAAIDVDYKTDGDEMMPLPLEQQESPIKFQVDEDSSNEVICVE